MVWIGSIRPRAAPHRSPWAASPSPSSPRWGLSGQGSWPPRGWGWPWPVPPAWWPWCGSAPSAVSPRLPVSCATRRRASPSCSGPPPWASARCGSWRQNVWPPLIPSWWTTPWSPRRWRALGLPWSLPSSSTHDGVSSSGWPSVPPRPCGSPCCAWPWGSSPPCFPSRRPSGSCPTVPWPLPYVCAPAPSLSAPRASPGCFGLPWR